MFQRGMDIILASVKQKFALVYIENIVILSKTLQKLIAYTKIVLTYLKEAYVTLKLKKCVFFTNRID